MPLLETVEQFVVIGDGDSGQPPERAALRGAARGGDGRPRLARAGRALARGPLLHVGHHRQSQGRPLLAPDAGGARADHRRPRRLPRRGGRPGALHRADVPRDGLEPGLRRRAERRRPGDARPPPPVAAPRAADRGGAGDLHRRRAHDLHGPPAPRRAARLRPEQPADRALRRHPGPAGADGGVRAPARGGGHPGLGHDRDPAGRGGGPRSPGRRRGRALGAQGHGRAHQPPLRDARRSTTTARCCPGTASPRGRSRSAGPAWPASTTWTPRRRPRRSGTAAGCAPATSARSTRTAGCGSATAPRT